MYVVRYYESNVNRLIRRKGRWVMGYEKPSIQIIIFKTSNMIVTSGLGDDPESEKKDSEDW